jgi:ferric-dicitrate binding protein FerR (iron transport regulator)
MDIHKFRKILQRYSNGEANETETALVEAWYRSYSTNESSLCDEDLNTVRKKMLRNIKNATAKRSFMRNYGLQIAAGLAIFLSAALLIRSFAVKNDGEECSVISTGTKGLRRFSLADGSTVWLNAASRLKAPIAFKGSTREVFLEEGEAFFDVKKDTERPFVVHTNPLDVRVFGTSFNVKAYKKLKQISVYVATGKVGVAANQKTLGMLTPGRQLDYATDNGVSEIKIIDNDRPQSWKLGYTYLDQADFGELSMTLKNIYGLSIKPGSAVVENYRFSLRLLHDLPPAEILELISQLHHTKIRREGNDIIFY